MRLAPLVLLPALLLSGCGSDGGGSSSGSKLEVVAAAYPFGWLAEQVGGPDVKVTGLVKPGAEPHDIELTPRQVGAVQTAAVVLYLKGFQPAVDDALRDGEQGYDLGSVVTQQPLREGDEQTAEDPHIWLDPVRMQAAATGIADRLAAKDPDHAAGYRARAKALSAQLGALDATFRQALTGCARKDVVTSHSAFGYLAARYGLVQRGISGLTPDAEPSPRRVAEVARFARDHGVTTIFFESLVDPKVARTVAAEIGARTAVLDPIEGVTGGDDYLSVQRRNAQALHDALACG
jgi:zinc transport system substrate-binding protein